jgi:uncharacterized protein
MLENKLNKLKKILSDMGSVIIAYSGGVDSAFLARVACEVLKNRALAVTAVSALYPADELARAVKAAKEIGIEHIIIKSKELQNSDFVKNSALRCYYCKKELFNALRGLAEKKKINHIVTGTNKNDENDYRPGMKATEEYGVRSPLLEAGFHKDEIRALSKKYKLVTAGQPASPCLASRIPYGCPITKDILLKVSVAEKYLRQLGLTEFRVRHHGSIARLEVPKKDIQFVIKNSKKIIYRLKKTGYTYICLDLEGFRSGSLNEVLAKK